MKTELLKDLVERIEKEKLNVFGIAVRQHGQLLDTHDIGVPKGRIQLYSASKTWTAMAIGIAEGEGRLTIDDRLADIFSGDLPEDTAEGFEKLRVRHLLQMGTGHAVCPTSRVREKLEAEGKDITQTNYSDYWFDAFCREPIVHEPDEGWYVYNNGATYMLSCIITKLTGLSLRDYLMPRVFEPLKIEDPHWDADSKGRSLGATGLHLNTEELSRGGQLLLNGGVWEGKQLIPEAYVHEMSEKHIDNSNGVNLDPEASAGYCFQMWRCTYPGAYRMDGFGAKYCIQLPDLDAVAAITSHETRHGYDILRAVWDTLVPKLSETV